MQRTIGRFVYWRRRRFLTFLNDRRRQRRVETLNDDKTNEKVGKTTNRVEIVAPSCIETRVVLLTRLAQLLADHTQAVGCERRRNRRAGRRRRRCDGARIVARLCDELVDAETICDRVEECRRHTMRIEAA